MHPANDITAKALVSEAARKSDHSWPNYKMADLNEKTHDGYRDSDATATNVEDAHRTNGVANDFANPPEKDIRYDGGPKQPQGRKRSFADIDESELSAAFENPLAGIEKHQLMKNVEDFCKDHNLMEFVEDFKKGALVAQNPGDWRNMAELSEEERLVLERETTHRWSQPWMLYWLVVMCSVSIQTS